MRWTPAVLALAGGVDLMNDSAIKSSLISN